jgi:ABC-type polysaccharide/polyol phosphate export permease
VLVAFNPMTGPIQVMHLAVLGHADKVGEAAAVTWGYVLVLGVITVLAYRRHERTAIDRL